MFDFFIKEFYFEKLFYMTIVHKFIAQLFSML